MPRENQNEKPIIEDNKAWEIEYPKMKDEIRQNVASNISPTKNEN